MKKSRWTEPLYSRNQVRKAGEAEARFDLDDFSNNFEKIKNWRAAHAYPMQVLSNLLRRKSKEVDPDAIVVQRLKRMASILGKLYRFPNMGLDRMQDIAGCRSIVKSRGEVYWLKYLMLTSESKYLFHHEKDYIENPKESGYRSIHLIYKYAGRKVAYKNMFVELQLRSRIQHSWATAVEIIDTFTGQALKTSQGRSDWEDFFRLASNEFANLEKSKNLSRFQGINTKPMLEEKMRELDVEKRLNIYAQSTRYLEEQANLKQDTYFVMDIDVEKRINRIRQFSDQDFDNAYALYAQLEESHQEEKRNVVLVKAETIDKLRLAYPNYFADSKSFIKNLNHVFDKADD